MDRDLMKMIYQSDQQFPSEDEIRWKMEEMVNQRMYNGEKVVDSDDC